MIYDDDEQPHDPDGYSNLEIDSLLHTLRYSKESTPSLKARESSRRLSEDEVDERLRRAYNGRVVRTGPYMKRMGTTLKVECTACGWGFRQNTECLFRGANTRCPCNRSKSWVAKEEKRRCL